MKPGLEARLRCPVCRAPAPFVLETEEVDAQEVRAGTLTCSNCRHVVAIADGIVRALHEPPGHVVAEAAGLARFADFMRFDHWTRETVLALPHRPEGYWWNQAVLIEQVLHQVPAPAGTELLDLGSNTCWAAARFAREGYDVTALDIAEHELQGLRTAEWWMEDRGVFMERVLGTMADLPFADGSFDRVWANEVLHHNDGRSLRTTLRECFRVLRPGGKLVVANEPLLTLREPRIRLDPDVAAYDGYEHAFARATYTRAARRAGFDVEVRGAGYHRLFQLGGIGLRDDMGLSAVVGGALVQLARKSVAARRVWLTLQTTVLGGTSLHMVCTRPAS